MSFPGFPNKGESRDPRIDRSGIFKILLVLVRSGIWIFSRTGPGPNRSPVHIRLGLDRPALVDGSLGESGASFKTYQEWGNHVASEPLVFYVSHFFVFLLQFPKVIFLEKLPVAHSILISCIKNVISSL